MSARVSVLQRPLKTEIENDFSLMAFFTCFTVMLSHTTGGALYGNPIWDKARHVMKDKYVLHHVTSWSFYRLCQVSILFNIFLLFKSCLFTVYDPIF
jgi:hypothetical protein